MWGTTLSICASDFRRVSKKSVFKSHEQTNDEVGNKKELDVKKKKGGENERRKKKEE